MRKERDLVLRLEPCRSSGIVLTLARVLPSVCDVVQDSRTPNSKMKTTREIRTPPIPHPRTNPSNAFIEITTVSLSNRQVLLPERYRCIPLERSKRSTSGPWTVHERGKDRDWVSDVFLFLFLSVHSETENLSRRNVPWRRHPHSSHARELAFPPLRRSCA